MSMANDERRDLKTNAIDIGFECGSLTTTSMSPLSSSSSSGYSSSSSSEVMIYIRFLHDDAKALFKATKGSSGFDICAVKDITIGKRSSVVVETGLRLEIPEGVYGNIKGRSGLAFERDVVAFDGTIDSDYEGEVKVKLFNLGKKNYTINKGDRIAQIVFTPLQRVYIGYRERGYESDDDDDEDNTDKSSILSDRERGGNGFGSSGR